MQKLRPPLLYQMSEPVNRPEFLQGMRFHARRCQQKTASGPGMTDPGRKRRYNQFRHGLTTMVEMAFWGDPSTILSE
jgi:hypothetical protein